MIRFVVNRELHFEKHLGLYISFGVCAYQDQRPLLHIPDVFCHRRDADAFVRLCNAEQPEPVHLRDLIEDVL